MLAPLLAAALVLAPAASNTDDTIIDLGAGVKVDVCLYTSVDVLTQDVADLDGGVALLADLTVKLGAESFAERRAKCAAVIVTPTPTSTPTPSASATPSASPAPSSKPSSTKKSSSAKAKIKKTPHGTVLPKGAPETGGGPVEYSALDPDNPIAPARDSALLANITVALAGAWRAFLAWTAQGRL